MGAILGGTMRSPFTGIVFALELTHDVNMLLPLLVAVTIAHGFTVLVMRRSILTEKIARRGYHLSREYATDPLEILFAREVMRRNVTVLPATARPEDLRPLLDAASDDGQRLYPVVDGDGLLVGVVRLRRLVASGPASLDDVIERDPVVAHPDEPLRMVAYRMAETGLTRLPSGGAGYQTPRARHDRARRPAAGARPQPRSRAPAGALPVTPPRRPAPRPRRRRGTRDAPGRVIVTSVLRMPRRLRRPQHPARACHRAFQTRVHTPTQDVVLGRLRRR
jgi:CBS domain-containing protein